MTVANVLIVYGTKEGHTATIAERMREAIAAKGHDVRVERAGSPPPAIPTDIDAVLVGASIHVSKHQAEVREFVKRNRQRLSTMPSAFFQVCLTAADPSPDSEAETQVCLDEFADWTGWHPQTTTTFAGMLAWTQYDFFTRHLMKLVLRKQHLPPEQLDTSHDFDYTDYDAVKRFAEEFADALDSH
jgi:menaquinone-dependent protoporphyrinogen oxidase